MAFAPCLAKSACVRPDQFPGTPAKTPAPRYGAKKHVTESRVVHGAVENSPAAVLSLELRHRDIGELGLDLFRFFADGDGSRHDVNLRVPFDILNLSQQDFRLGIGYRNGIEDIDVADGSVLALEPAASFQKRRYTAGAR